MYVSPVIKRKTSEATNVIIGQNVITEVLKCNRGVTGTIGDIIYWHSCIDVSLFIRDAGNDFLIN